MPEYKRIYNLDQSSSSMPDDYLILDREDQVESKKISKQDFLDGMLEEPVLENSLPSATWARRNGEWIEIYPDDYVLEANMDGQSYLRRNGDWVSIDPENIKGDMYQFVYDTKKVSTDIFDTILNKNCYFTSYRNFLVNGRNLLLGNFINSNFTFREALKDFQYVAAPKDGKTVNKIIFYNCNNELFFDRTFALGEYYKNNQQSQNYKGLFSLFAVPVKKGDVAYFKNISENDCRIKFIKVTKNNDFISYLNIRNGLVKTDTIIFKDEISITFDEDCYVGYECSLGTYENNNFQPREDFVTIFSNALERYKFPVIGSLNEKVQIKEVIISNGAGHIASSSYPLKIDFLNSKVISPLTSIQTVSNDWDVKSSVEGFLTIYKTLDQGNVTEVFIPGYNFNSNFTSTAKKECGIVTEDGQKYVAVNIPQEDYYNSNFNLTISYNLQFEENFDSYNIEDGSRFFVGVSYYSDGTKGYGYVLITQDGIADYYLRKSGGEIQGEVVFHKPVTFNDDVLLEKIFSRNKQTQIQLNDQLLLKTAGKITEEADNKTSEFKNNYTIKTNKLLVESKERPTINNNEVLIKNDFVIGENGPQGLDWQPQGKTGSSLGNGKNLVNEEYLINYFPPRDGTQLEKYNQEAIIKNYKIVDINGENISIKNLVITGLLNNRPLILNQDGSVAASEITVDELNSLLGIKTDVSIQDQLDAIPKYKYLNGQTIVVTDDELKASLGIEDLSEVTDAQIWDAMVLIGKDQLTYNNLMPGYTPKEWDCISLRLERAELEIFKDALYFYNKENQWVFLYFLSTTVNRASGNLAGIVEDSEQVLIGFDESTQQNIYQRDITWKDGRGTVHHSEKSSFLQIQTLGENIDLDTLNNDGFYKGGGVGSPSLNAPTENAFILQVASEAQTCFDLTDYKIFTRFHNSSGWSEWGRIYSTFDEPPGIGSEPAFDIIDGGNY